MPLPWEAVVPALEVAVDDPLQGLFDGQKPLLASLADHLEAPLPGPPADGPEVEGEELVEPAAGEQLGGDQT